MQLRCDDAWTKMQGATTDFITARKKCVKRSILYDVNCELRHEKELVQKEKERLQLKDRRDREQKKFEECLKLLQAREDELLEDAAELLDGAVLDMSDDIANNLSMD